VRILLGVVNGMIVLHDNEIIHRDISARNILIDSDFTAKIADYGLARRLNADGVYALRSNQKLPLVIFTHFFG
jgi:serine/threonine protein kinase